MHSPDKPPRSLVALDYGGRRIGIATGSCITGTATPLTTAAAVGGEPDWDSMDSVINEWQPDLLVLGLPFNSDGTDSDMTSVVREFAVTLQNRYKLTVELIDERYTSVEAEARLKDERQRGIRNKKLKKEDIDAKAAQIIAESWMRKTGGHSPS